MDAGDQQRLLEYAEKGGCVILGPGMPYLDSNLRPCSILSAAISAPGEVSYGAGCLIWATAETLASVLAQNVPAPTVRWDTPAVEVVEQVGEQQHLLFIANPQEQRQQVTISFETPRHLSPVWGAAAASRSDQLTLDLAPYTIQIWETTHD